MGGTDEDPRAWLGDVERLRAAARRDDRSWWFPLTLFGAAMLLAAPLYVPWSGPPTDAEISGRTTYALVLAFGGVFTPRPVVIAVYWAVALAAGFLLTGLWYRRRAARVGLRRPVVFFVLTGLLTTAGLVLVPALPFGFFVSFWVGWRGTGAVAVVAVAVVVLARVHRSRALAAVAVVLLGLAVLVGTYNVENLLFRAGVPFGEWAQATGIVLPGLFLLACGLAGRAAGRRRAPSGALAP